MLLEILAEKLEYISAQDKSLLLSFVSKYRYDSTGRITVKKIAQELGVSDKRITSSLNKLVKGEIIVRHSFPVRVNGRPSYSYFINREWLEKLLRNGGEKGRHIERHEALIYELFSQDSTDIGHAHFRTAVRLLLATLIAHADQRSIVRNVGMADLGKLTGLKKDAIKSAMEDLIETGYIYSKIPARLEPPKLLGEAGSLYFLNLSNSKFKNGIYKIMLILADRRARTEGEVKRLVGLCRRAGSYASEGVWQAKGNSTAALALQETAIKNAIDSYDLYDKDIVQKVFSLDIAKYFSRIRGSEQLHFQVMLHEVISEILTSYVRKHLRDEDVQSFELIPHANLLLDLKLVAAQSQDEKKLRGSFIGFMSLIAVRLVEVIHDLIGSYARDSVIFSVLPPPANQKSHRIFIAIECSYLDASEKSACKLLPHNDYWPDNDELDDKIVSCWSEIANAAFVHFDSDGLKLSAEVNGS